jgi:hypothetical protein
LSWIRFEEVKDTGKTKIWNIWSEANDSYLGEVRWYSKWRQYVYHCPGYQSAGTLWNVECMKELTDFIEERMAERKK